MIEPGACISSRCRRQPVFRDAVSQVMAHAGTQTDLQI
jgi:hypothetical protein